MPNSQLLADRRTFSRERLGQLRAKLMSLPEVKGLPDLCIYATGSYARHEASKHSDIDLFFLHRGSRQGALVSRLDELRLFARVIEIGKEMGFPTFSNDGEFLRVLYLDDMLHMLGGREDDFRNFFTARMLLLLESENLVNANLHSEVLASIVEAYFRDYPDHQDTFRPVFLINDVLRFWKTLCLNYEHRRNRPEDNETAKRKQQIKNFKLKFSRLITCFGTVIAICSMEAPINPESILPLTTQVPLDRLLSGTAGIEELTGPTKEILADYEWFMLLTALSTRDLTVRFEDRERRVEMFRRAELFGEKVYSVIDFLANQNGYRRFLVV